MVVCLRTLGVVLGKEIVMRLKWLVVLVLVGFGFCGCRSSRSMIRDYRLYEGGEVERASALYEEGIFENTTTYYRDGRVKSEKWLQHGRPVVVLEFYNDSRLRSEERFLNGEVTYGVYYGENGRIERTVGQIAGEGTKSSTW